MRRNGHWVLAKGIDFEAAFRFKLHPHDFGLTVGPTVFEPTRQPPERPTATIESRHRSQSPGCSTPASPLAKRRDTAGPSRITGDRTAATTLLDRLSLGPLLP